MAAGSRIDEIGFAATGTFTRWPHGAACCRRLHWLADLGRCMPGQCAVSYLTATYVAFLEHRPTRPRRHSTAAGFRDATAKLLNMLHGAQYRAESRRPLERKAYWIIPQ